jgi:hypothetical protein
VTAEPVLVATSCFALGMVLQAFLMLGGRFRRGDWGRVAGALASWFIGLVPGKNEQEYRLLEHVFYGLLVAGVMFTYLFRDRLLPRIGGRMLLAWNLLLVYVVVNRGWDSRLEVSLLIIPTVLTVVNAFTDIDRDFGWKVFFQAWFPTILVVISIKGFDAGLLGVFDAKGGVALAPRSPFEMIAGGAAFLYIVANAWFVLALVPIPLSRTQSWDSRMKEVRAHMDLLARGYVWGPDDRLRSLAVLVGLPVALIVMSYAGANMGSVVPFAIAMMPLVAGRVEPEPMVPDAESKPKRAKRRRG